MIATISMLLYNKKKGIGVMEMDKQYSYADFLKAMGQAGEGKLCGKFVKRNIS